MEELKEVKIDSRGAIYSFEEEGKQYLLEYTLTGFKRGGDIHTTNQVNLLLQGCVVLVTKDSNGKLSYTYQEAPAMLMVHAEVPHMFISEIDSLMVEYHFGKEGPTAYDEQLRKYVMKQEPEISKFDSLKF